MYRLVVMFIAASAVAATATMSTCRSTIKCWPGWVYRSSIDTAIKIPMTPEQWMFACCERIDFYRPPPRPAEPPWEVMSTLERTQFVAKTALVLVSLVALAAICRMAVKDCVTECKKEELEAARNGRYRQRGCCEECCHCSWLR